MTENKAQQDQQPAANPAPPQETDTGVAAGIAQAPATPPAPAPDEDKADMEPISSPDEVKPAEAPSNIPPLSQYLGRMVHYRANNPRMAGAEGTECSVAVVTWLYPDGTADLTVFPRGGNAFSVTRAARSDEFNVEYARPGEWCQPDWA